VAADGSPAAQGGKDARISNDGSIVAFTSRSSDIVPHQSPGYYDAFVRNLKTGETVQIDVLNGAKPPLAGGETEVKGISGDGRLVIVSSDARHVPGTDQDSIELYLYDTKTGKLSLASVDSKGQPVKLGLSLTEGDTGAISADGRTVAFVASAPNFVGGYDQIYARRLGTGQ
jgi:Tol biopolymer transport system component